MPCAESSWRQVVSYFASWFQASLKPGSRTFSYALCMALNSAAALGLSLCLSGCFVSANFLYACDRGKTSPSANLHHLSLVRYVSHCFSTVYRARPLTKELEDLAFLISASVNSDPLSNSRILYGSSASFQSSIVDNDLPTYQNKKSWTSSQY